MALAQPIGDTVAPAAFASPVLLAVDTVRKGFNTRAGSGATWAPVLDRVSFDVHEGEIVSLLGTSGCGKTTLLKIIAGLIRADAGAVTVKGARVQGPRKDLCMVFQQFSLLPWRTVLANVAFPLELDGVGRAEREGHARRYLEIVGLSGFEQHYPHELSGGMQQRVGIARGLVRKPLILLMDEPFGALDAQTRETLQEDFLGIWKQLNTTVVLVTHSIDEALLLSDRVIVFSSRPGRIKAIIRPPFVGDRSAGDVRARPEFAAAAGHVRELLRAERTP
ncbi:MAG: ABC transporter ATP-binding protein [Alphaproteobacteria bacterium]